MTTPAKSGGIPKWVWIVIIACVGLPVVAALLLVVLGMGAGMLTYFRFRDARVSSASADAQTVQAAAQLYQVENPGRGCPSVQDLVDSGAMQRGREHDPWGRPWEITCTGNRVTVTSPGADGNPHTSDDIRAE